TITCDYCKRKGHTMSDCYRNPQNQTKPTGIVSTPDNNTTSVFDSNNTSDTQEDLIEVKANADPIMKVFEPFVNAASVSLLNNPTQRIPVQVLRDTGASQSLILTNTLPFSAESYSGNNVLIKGVHSSDYSSVPLHNIRLHSDLVSGDVSIGIIDTLPFDGIQLLLGNDLAGEKVTVNPIVTNKPMKPCSTSISDVIEQEIPNLYPSCAVTRAMVKQQELENNKRDDLDSSYDLSDTFLTQLFDSGPKTTQITKNDAIDTKSLSTSNLIHEQNNDPEIAILIQQAFDEKEISDQAMGYFIKNDILMRKWRPPDVRHLGINKTYEKIIRHFYWPGVRKTVAEFCKTCHTCQVVGKANQVIPKAPLKPIPAFEEPFSRIMIDCVGPLPKTKRGNQYLLTIMCVSTRFPEAIPLRNIKAKTIVEALTKFFTLVGLPKSIQSDQGSNFTSGLFQQIMHELGIKQYNSSAYHPESQGALERFHQTLKQMIKTYCFETEKDWDDGVHFLLFAARESVQESLGFSPFELVFGHTVRGPLKLLKEKLLTDDGGSLNILQYVTDFRTKLTKACDLARKNLKTAQNRMKHSYDKNTVTRNFQNGDKVLALLPVPGNPLQASLSETTKLSNSDVLRNMDSKLSHLQPSQRQDVLDLVNEYAQLFPDIPSRTDMISHDVDIGDASPIKQHPYRLNPSKAKYLDQEIQYLLENDFIEHSQSSWSSPCILVPKPDGSYRMCTDYRKVNNLTKSDNFPIPRMDDCVDKIGNAKYVSKFDLLKGFWQIPLSERAKEVSAFVTPRGLYQYKVMPFGMRNSPATFQRLINQIISQIDGCEGYIDDVIIYSDTWEEHLEILRKFFKRLSEAKLTINLVKSEFGCGHVTYLGHIVGQGQVKPVNAKVEAIADFPQPTTKKHIMRLLGMAGYYRKFCPNFSSITEPLTQLLRKDMKFVWTEQCQKAFEKLKAMLQNAPVLSAPDFNRPFKLAIDASDVAAGAVLLQEGQFGVDHPVCYFSRKFNKHQRNYSTIEKECLALVLALQHFEVYVSSTSVPLEVFSDHNPLMFLHKMKNKNQRLLRWSLVLSEYDMKMEHIKGRDNLLADCLSRP
ncbi:Retrovirus-related Pol poly from transposon, partial [Paramuricea clavata]